MTTNFSTANATYFSSWFAYFPANQAEGSDKFTEKIELLLKLLRLPFIFLRVRRIPFHQGIKGIERVDGVAKEATKITLQETLATSNVRENKKFLFGKVRVEWDNSWKRIVTKLYKVRDNIFGKHLLNSKNRREEAIINRLRTDKQTLVTFLFIKEIY